MPRATGTKSAKSKPKLKPAESYKHPESDSPMRPEVGTQAQFKKKLPPKAYDVAKGYFQLTESILEAMIDATVRPNLPVVFVLNRPFFHACYKGMWTCLTENPSKIPDDLLQLGVDIDEAIEQKFEEWNAPFFNQAPMGRYAAFLESPIQKQLSDEGKIKPSTLIERLHTDVHGGLPSLVYYQQLMQEGNVLHAAKELCVFGHDPLYLNLRFAISMRFPDGPVARENLLADPFAQQILAIHGMPEP